MGTQPRKPAIHPFQESADIVAAHLRKYGHKVNIIEKQGLRYVLCDDYVTIADNLEADLTNWFPSMISRITLFPSYANGIRLGRATAWKKSCSIPSICGTNTAS